ncbi:MAG: RidA family protein [Gemmatimonadaceae bacterium]
MSDVTGGQGHGPAADPQVLRPEGWAPPRGYTDGVVVSGRQVVLSGQVGWNPATAAIEIVDLAGQVRQALSNVVTLLAEAGAEARHLVRLTWYVTDRDEYLAERRAIGLAYREVIGMHYPPMSVVFVGGLVEDGARVEIEATAVVPG